MSEYIFVLYIGWQDTTQNILWNAQDFPSKGIIILWWKNVAIDFRSSRYTVVFE